MSLAFVGLLLALGAPPGSPPHVAGTAFAPPAAWISVGKSSHWLVFGSYCWRTTCADMLPPTTRHDIPVLRARRGTTVRFHLRFRPTRVRLMLLGDRGVTRTWRLAAVAAPTWRFAATGTFVLETKASPGSAGYVFRLR